MPAKKTKTPKRQPTRREGRTIRIDAKVSDKAIGDALKKNAGMVTLAAIEVKLSHQNLRRRIDRSPMLTDILTELEDRMVDQAEGNIRVALVKGDLTTSRWYLERKGKARGYRNEAEAPLSAAQIREIVDAFGPDRAAITSFLNTLEAPKPD